MMDQEAFHVDRVRSATNALHYRLHHQDEVRNLHLYLRPDFHAAVVTSETKQILAVAFSLSDPAREGRERRFLVEFTGESGRRDDTMTQAVLQSTNVARLPLPKSLSAVHWKDSAVFLRTMPSGEMPAPIIAPVKSVGSSRKSVLEDAFCSPPITVKLNSALNACFQSVCSFIKCTNEGGSCIKEAQEARAFCLAEG